ncbi:MAG: AmmeMemoRadiSam system protein B [Deltaproteobacteria bacterium]|nr:AmmeMemoRadiSam system protein B [Deltaproteobacteria bacterium]
MSQDPSFPKLRELHVFPAELSGRPVVGLRDPLNLSGKVLFFPPPAFFLIQLCDGRHSLVDLQAEFLRRFGGLLFREKIQELLDQLEENYFLDSERFRRVEGEMIRKFQDSPIRPSTLAGESYENRPEDLRQTIDSYFRHPDGPGEGGPPASGLTGAIAPHIDYRRGGPCYAWAHRALGEASADLFVILGTAHAPLAQPFALCRKDFETPFGPVETDRSFLAEFEARCPFDPYADEFAHQAEHSIELQVVFLRAVRRKPFAIVPVLCGSLHEAVRQGLSPLELPGVGGFLEAVRSVLVQSPRRICLLASADLAHVGPQFGDGEAPSRFSLEALAADDRELLGFAERLDGEGFYRCVQREGDRRRICGLPPIYALLHLVPPGRGRLLKYSQALDPATHSAVTFASLAFDSGGDPSGNPGKGEMG